MNIETIIDKIKKLRRLATSSNEHEAAVAAAKAAELLTEYQLEEAHLAAETSADDPVKDDIPFGHMGRQKWKGLISTGVAAVVGIRTYLDSRDGMIRAIGRKVDVAAASYLFEAIVDDVNRLAKQSSREYLEAVRENDGEAAFAQANKASQVRRWKNAFRLGAALTVSERLHSSWSAMMRARRSGDNQALLVLNNRQMEIELRAKKMNLGDMKPPRVGDYSGFFAGRIEGKKVDIQQTSAGLLGPAKPRQIRGSSS